MDYGTRKGKSPYLAIEIGAAGGSSGSARSGQVTKLQRVNSLEPEKHGESSRGSTRFRTSLCDKDSREPRGGDTRFLAFCT